MPIERFVIMGSSSGGYEAMSYLVPKLELNGSAAVFLMPHVNSDEIYTHLVTTDVDVVGVKDNTTFEPGKVYVASPKFWSSCERFKDSEFKEGGIVFTGQRHSDGNINRLMIGAAEFYKEKCVGVVLSGLGKDGMRGLNHIQQCGGATFVQSENGSLQDDDASDAVGNYRNAMPSNALQKTDVDFDGSIQKMAPVLNSYLK